MFFLKKYLANTLKFAPPEAFDFDSPNISAAWKKWRQCFDHVYEGSSIIHPNARCTGSNTTNGPRRSSC